MMRLASVSWRLALSACFVVLAWRLWQLPALVDMILAREAEATRQALQQAVSAEGERLDKRLVAIQADASEHLVSIEANLFTQTRDLSRNTDYRLQQVTRSLDRNLTALRMDAIAELRRTNEELTALLAESRTLLPPLNRTLAMAAENAELLGDCAGNPDCFANRAIPALRAVENLGQSSVRIADSADKILSATAKVAPQATQDAAAALASTRTITRRLASPWGIVTKVLKKVGRKVLFFWPW